MKAFPLGKGETKWKMPSTRGGDKLKVQFNCRVCPGGYKIHLYWHCTQLKKRGCLKNFLQAPPTSSKPKGTRGVDTTRLMWDDRT